jgi:hypothetical protein
MRLVLAALIAAAGLAVAQPALAEGGFDPARAAQSLCSTPAGQKLGADCLAKLTSLLTSCKSQTSSPDAFKACVRTQLPAEPTQKGSDLDPGRLARSLCSTPAGQKLGADCVAKLTALVEGCKSKVGSPDSLKACIQALLPAGDTHKGADPDPARLAQSLCRGPLGQKLGEGCVARLTAVVAACTSKAGARDAFKACVTAQLPTEGSAGGRGDLDPGRAATAACTGLLGQKLGSDCVAKLKTLIASCRAQSPPGDTWKSCVAAQLRTTAPSAK